MNKIQIETMVFTHNGVIEQTCTYPISEQITKKVIKTKEGQIKQALKGLGWLSPEFREEFSKEIDRWLYDHSNTVGLDRHTINVVAKSFQELIKDGS